MGFICIAKLWALFNVIASSSLVFLILVSAIFNIGEVWANYEYEILILVIYLMMNVISSLILLNGLKTKNGSLILFGWLIVEGAVFFAKFICFCFIIYGISDEMSNFRITIPVLLLLTNLGYHLAFVWAGYKCIIEIDEEIEEEIRNLNRNNPEPHMLHNYNFDYEYQQQHLLHQQEHFQQIEAARARHYSQPQQTTSTTAGQADLITNVNINNDNIMTTSTTTTTANKNSRRSKNPLGERKI